MKQAEFDAFTEVLTTVADYYRVSMKPGTIALWWNALMAFDLLTVKGLLTEHVATAKFMPTIAELLDALKSMDGRPDPEEAWSIVARSLQDESVTVVWTQEMAQAFGVALGLSNDRVAARMAFKEAYQNAVREARKQSRPAKWTASLGHDVGGREGVLVQAQRQGKLTADYVSALLPYREQPSPEVRALIENKPKQLTPA
jgi:hypothetical protein